MSSASGSSASSGELPSSGLSSGESGESSEESGQSSGGSGESSGDSGQSSGGSGESSGQSGESSGESGESSGESGQSSEESGVSSEESEESSESDASTQSEESTQSEVSTESQESTESEGTTGSEESSGESESQSESESESQSESQTPSSSSESAGEIVIKYIAGYDSGDALKEHEEAFTSDDEYFMKGYMLAFESPPIKAGTSVTWNVKQGGIEKGTYHPTGAWTDYFNTVTPKPSSQKVYWRSDYSATENLAQTYTISCTYTPPEGDQRTVTRDLKSRELDPDSATVRDNANTDTKMVQRAIIQVFGLDKGRLDSWQVGKYQKNGGSPPYYHSTTGGGGAGRNWSKIADEVWNFDRYVIHTTSGTSYNLKARQINGIWSQFELILAAGNIGEVRLNGVNVASSISGAGLTPPSGFPKTAADIVSAICKHEGNSSNPYHSYVKFSPLAINNVRVGENALGDGADKHSFTDWGIGFAAIQPYNSGGKNLYKPADNLFRCAQFFQGILSAQIPSVATGAKAKVWYGCYIYNQGSVPSNSSPLALRNQGTDGAAYADDVFNRMGVALPNANSD